MRNEQFKRLVSLLEADPELLHDFLVKGGSRPEVDELLVDNDRWFVRNTPGAVKLVNALFKDAFDEAARMDAVAACTDSCGLTCGESVRFTEGIFARLAAMQCECTKAETCGLTCGGGSTCGPGSCDYTCEFTSAAEYSGEFTPAAEFAARQRDRFSASAALQCDENVTCSCTSSTCGGVTCGGSTCDATCTGDSCGNTCGDSCGWTTNVVRRSGVSWGWGRQRDFWR